VLRWGRKSRIELLVVQIAIHAVHDALGGTLRFIGNVYLVDHLIPVILDNFDIAFHFPSDEFEFIGSGNDTSITLVSSFGGGEAFVAASTAFRNGACKEPPSCIESG
jgi:hypothetical protein